MVGCLPSCQRRWRSTASAGVAARSFLNELRHTVEVDLDTQAGGLGYRGVAIDDLDRVAGDTSPQWARLHAILQHQRIGHGGQKVKRRSDVYVGGEVMVAALYPTLLGQSGDPHSLGKTDAGEVDLDNIDVAFVHKAKETSGSALFLAGGDARAHRRSELPVTTQVVGV